MRFSSRPVSSPGRAENYPPLLMRFLRTNVGSKSRGRSRSSPIFVRRKNTPPDTQEPSSPKVTCMGQVRITRSKKPKPASGPGPGRVAGKRRRRRRCGWVKNAFFCHPFAGKLKPSCFSPVWRKWVSFSHVSFSRKSEKRSSSTRSEPIFGSSTVGRDEPQSRREEEEEEVEVEKEANSSKSFASTPPRNALLLTRCRSAPYRSSSLASRFWGSPVSGEQEEQSGETEEVQTQQQQQTDGEEDSNAAQEKVSVSVESTSVTETERLEDSAGESQDRGDAKQGLFVSPQRRRLVLTRCKSAPPRTGEKLVPELGFWKNRRLGFT